jgi:hypothetical protein
MIPILRLLVGGAVVSGFAIIDYTAPRAEGKSRVWTPLAQRWRWGASVCSCLLLIVWHFIPNHRAWAVLKIATLAWLGVSVMMWMIRKRV